jgi:hypothetical protein
MVQILPYVDRGQNAVQRLAGGFGKAIETGKQAYQEMQQISALEKMGLDKQALQGLSPENRSQLLQEGMHLNLQTQRARKTEGINYGPEDFANEIRKGKRQQFAEDVQQTQRQELPEFTGTKQKNKFFPSNIGAQESVGNLPQPETSGVKKRILTQEELLAEGARIARMQNDAGVPTEALEGYKIAKSLNDENRKYNSDVEADVKQRVESQRNYGNIAVDKLDKVHPGATDEQRAIFRRKGEEAAARSTKESDIDRELAKEAVKFKNTLANVKASIPPMRLLSKAKANLLGTDRSADKARDDIRIKLKPILDEGLYDTARNLLSELGYHPEERESILSNIGESTKKTLSQMPKIEKPYANKLKGGLPVQEYTPQQNEMIKSNLQQIFQEDPSENLILLRKQFEDKGIDWQAFKDNLNELILSGQVKLNDDQFDRLDVLDNPPLNNLDKILHGLKLIGR